MAEIEYKHNGVYLPDNLRPVNKGYGDAGASHRKKAFKGFTASSGTAHEDIDFHNMTLRQRARMLYMASPIATSAIRTNRTNVIGEGLKLKSRINREALNLSQEAADEWEKRAEAEFELWAGKKTACDATGVNDFYAMQQLALISWLMSGDCFVLIKRYPATPLSPYGLRLHLIEADRVSTPMKKDSFNLIAPVDGEADNGNKIYDGVEIDGNGTVAAYHICNSDTAANKLLFKKEWQRVEIYGANTGLPNILQIMDAERPEQYRGVSFLAQIMEPLLQIRRYTESELMASVIESYFTAFIKVKSTPDMMPLNETNPDDKVSRDSNQYEMGPGVINVLYPDEDVTFADPKRPSSGFADFTRAISEQMGAAIEMPADLLVKAFNASYSASRAALLEAWKAFKMRRAWFVSDFCQPVYEIWLSEAVARGRISAPGFFTDPAMRAAWLSAEFIGPSQGQLDPVREITAELLAISEGLSTHEQSTVKLNGGSWDANIEQLAKESERLQQIQRGTESDVTNTELSKTVKAQLISQLVQEMTKNE